MMDCYRLFRRDRQGRQGGRMLYVMEGLDCTELADGDDMVESFWVRVKGKASNVVVVVGGCYRSPSQDNIMDKLLFKELRDVSRYLDFTGDLNLPDIKYYHTADRNKSKKFLKHIGRNFWYRC